MDIRHRRLPNYLTFLGMLTGILYNVLNSGLMGLFPSTAGLVLGIGLLLLPYTMGGMGAGDVKLMGAVGSFLGPKGVLIAFLFTAIVGGIYAVVILMFHRYLKENVRRYWVTLMTFIFTREIIYDPQTPKERKPCLYYGVAITIGTLISVLWNGMSGQYEFNF